MTVFPSSCPPAGSWTIIDPEFSPEEIWRRGGTLVKEAKKRRVIKASGYFIKAFRLAPGPAGRLRDPAGKEWVIAGRLSKRNLTPEPCAYGTSGRWSYFAAKKAEGLELEHYLKNHLPLLSRRKIKGIVEIFCEFFLDIAASGVLQPDFHLNNCLFNEKTEKFLLLDLHRARLKQRSLNSREILDQLVYVLPPLMEIMPGRNILEACSFLSSSLPGLKDRLVRYRIQERAFQNMRRHWDGKEKRKIAESEIVLRGPDGLKVKTTRNHDTSFIKAAAALVREPDRYLGDRTKVPEIIKDSRHTLCFRTVFDGKDFFVKAYRSSGHLKALSYLVRTPRSLRTWQLSRRLVYRNLRVMLPIAAIQAGNPWKRIYGAAVFPWIKETGLSKALIKGELKDPASFSVFLRRLAGFLWQMHERGVFHGDCKITNFVYFPQGKRRLMIFDLDSTRILKRVRQKERIADVSCMCRSLEKLASEKTTGSETWKGRDKRGYRWITPEFLKHYAFFHVPWQDELEKIIKDVNYHIHRKTVMNKDGESAGKR